MPFYFEFIVSEAGINLLLCLSVYLLLVNSKMPSTSTAFPLLTKFYGCAIIILVLAMCCTCLVYALYFMNSSGLELHDASVALKFKVRARVCEMPGLGGRGKQLVSRWRTITRNKEKIKENDPSVK